MVSWDEMFENTNGEKTSHFMEATADPNAARPDAGLLSADDRRVLLNSLAKLPQMQALVHRAPLSEGYPLERSGQDNRVDPVPHFTDSS